MTFILYQKNNHNNNWSKSSGANISLDKTNHLHICRKRHCSAIKLVHNNINIENVDNCKILGLNIDSKYSFKTIVII